MSVTALIGTMFGAAEAALELFAEREKNYPQKQSTAFAQRLSWIKKQYYEELARPENERSNAALDKYRLDFKLLMEEFTLAARGKK